ncbi:1,4-alpha-glucan-branching enzyme, partial [bacterium]
HWEGGQGLRIPACARRVVQDGATKIFSAQVWEEDGYQWRFESPPRSRYPVIYEAHVGMAGEGERVHTYADFSGHVLQRIADGGYDTVELMAVAEHPYYGSFGYHVSSFFAPSSRFGTPEELKALIDRAHGLGLRVVIDIVHSHCVKNEEEGLSRQDGSDSLYFHSGPRGYHPLWDSRLFDYGKRGVLKFLLSNLRYWLTEFRVDGFRFDGVTSMLYDHHGLGRSFTSYDDYFGGHFDEEAWAYLALANALVHKVNPEAITIAEDVSGAPGLCASLGEFGAGFDYRLALGVPDIWFKYADIKSDFDWNIGGLVGELTQRRAEERTVAYVESHDQALVGGKSMIFTLADERMYDSMHEGSESMAVERAVALHKMMRLLTLALSAGGYMTFMGNEFGHPEWIDFPREGNGWSYHHARRLWGLRDAPGLRYRFLGDFDGAMLKVFRERGSALLKEARVVSIFEEEKVAVVERGGLFWVFNFHPTSSYTDYPVSLPPGSYSLALDSDSRKFGGFGRVHEGARYFTFPHVSKNEMFHLARIYLPSRTALVLEEEGPRDSGE